MLSYNKKSGIKTVALILTFAFFLNLGVRAAHRTVLQQGIAEEVLRFHVLANSDSDGDQAVKYLVRDAVLAWLRENMPEEADSAQTAGIPQETTGSAQAAGIPQETSSAQTAGIPQETTGSAQSAKETSADREAVLRYLETHLAQIERAANDVLEAEGMPYRAAASVTTCYFPNRTYGAYTFPAGWYKALRIQLGEAKGHNWWCLLYPQLCFSDCVHAVLEDGETEELKKVLSVEEYESLLETPGKWKISFRWF